ncbi:hypothetical protein GGX14DRAFT_391485 [Mycena pura]|uniref:Uncharacterized protein n=1 Tax=Mycena pura TaxID=153505 RepID=A0AAD6VKM4_9AGAR|nr:hypothetical protein GGX14DRAFT_391485 [Mycena pura]
MTSAKGGSTLLYTVVVHFQATSQSCITDKHYSAEVRRCGAEDTTANTKGNLTNPASCFFNLRKFSLLMKLVCGRLTGTFDKRNITSSSSYLRGPQMVTHDVGQALPARQRSPISDI